MEEGYAQLYAGDGAALGDAVARRVLPERMAAATRAYLKAKPGDAAKAAWFRQRLETSRANLLRAWSAGVRLALGTDAGNPLVFHGAAVHRELRLWVEAGLPAEAVLRAATSGAAALLGAQDRIGGIRKGMDADLVLVEGNPLSNIGDTERISLIVYKGERLAPERMTD
jgi:imidazolonepropionase-like amidohydrolase